jgi:hypothetical protein
VHHVLTRDLHWGVKTECANNCCSCVQGLGGVIDEKIGPGFDLDGFLRAEGHLVDSRDSKEVPQKYRNHRQLLTLSIAIITD